MFNLWNQELQQYERKAEDHKDIFDYMEDVYHEFYHSKARHGARDAISRDITPYTREELRQMSREDRVSGGYLKPSGKKCLFCGEEIYNDRDKVKKYCNESCSSSHMWQKRRQAAQMALWREEVREMGDN